MFSLYAILSRQVSLEFACQQHLSRIRGVSSIDISIFFVCSLVYFRKYRGITKFGAHKLKSLFYVLFINVSVLGRCNKSSTEY